MSDILEHASLNFISPLTHFSRADEIESRKDATPSHSLCSYIEYVNLIIKVHFDAIVHGWRDN